MHSTRVQILTHDWYKEEWVHVNKVKKKRSNSWFTCFILVSGILKLKIVNIPPEWFSVNFRKYSSSTLDYDGFFFFWISFHCSCLLLTVNNWLLDFFQRSKTKVSLSDMYRRSSNVIHILVVENCFVGVPIRIRLEIDSDVIESESNVE